LDKRRQPASLGSKSSSFLFGVLLVIFFHRIFHKDVDELRKKVCNTKGQYCQHQLLK
jgi:hypothetical protein